MADVQRPNGDSNTSITDYNIRLKLAGDAIRSAIADVNHLYGKNLTADIVAPTTAGGSGGVNDRGKASLQQIRTDYQGQPITYDNFNTYSAQVYGNNGSAFGSEVAGIRARSPCTTRVGGGAGDAGHFLGVQPLHDANFYDMPETLETPSVFTDIASIYVNAMANGQLDVRVQVQPDAVSARFGVAAHAAEDGLLLRLGRRRS